MEVNNHRFYAALLKRTRADGNNTVGHNNRRQSAASIKSELLNRGNHICAISPLQTVRDNHFTASIIEFTDTRMRYCHRAVRCDIVAPHFH